MNPLGKIMGTPDLMKPWRPGICALLINDLLQPNPYHRRQVRPSSGATWEDVGEYVARQTDLQLLEKVLVKL